MVIKFVDGSEISLNEEEFKKVVEILKSHKAIKVGFVPIRLIMFNLCGKLGISIDFAKPHSFKAYTMQTDGCNFVEPLERELEVELLTFAKRVLVRQFLG